MVYQAGQFRVLEHFWYLLEALYRIFFNDFRAQIAYIEQLQGKTEAALTAYNKVLKNKPTDIALTAVISNNIVAIHKVSQNNRFI